MLFRSPTPTWASRLQGLNNSTAVEEFNTRERRRLESSCIPHRRTTQISNGLTEPGQPAYELAEHVQSRCCPPNRGAFLIGRQADATKTESYVEKAKEAPKDHSASSCGSSLPEREDHGTQERRELDLTTAVPSLGGAGANLRRWVVSGGFWELSQPLDARER